MGRKMTISVQGDLVDIIEPLRSRGHRVITNHEVSKDTSVFILSNVDEDWEEIKSLEWMDFGNNQYILTINASKIATDEILDVIDRLASKDIEIIEKPARVKISVEESLVELRELLKSNGYEVISSYKVDPDVSAIIFSGVDEIWETIDTYQMREYGDAKYVLTMNASNMTSEEILKTLNRLYGEQS
ncbi:YkuS family protein [Thermotalea metallivorans]|uniref:Uncharacterized protein n=1 Tax=Thermotalea metallivorans TaxID=520762 RepID=A0A140L9J2_9FIRM|nr:YkuS family protein [Thermotalea metallivorans]KXG77217.1 hypothetical protein AN619_07470 [Thermotalea metallivorans]